MFEGADRVRGRCEMRGREGIGEGSGGRRRGGKRGRNIGEKGKEGQKVTFARFKRGGRRQGSVFRVYVFLYACSVCMSFYTHAYTL